MPGFLAVAFLSVGLNAAGRAVVPNRVVQTNKRREEAKRKTETDTKTKRKIGLVCRTGWRRFTVRAAGLDVSLAATARLPWAMSLGRLADTNTVIPA